MEKPVTALPADTRGILNPQAGASRFGLTRHAPGPEMQERVERHWIVRWDLRGQSPFTQEVLPHPCVNLVFERGEGRVYGVVRSKFSRRLEGAGVGVGTKFRPGAFAGFTDVPMASLVERFLAERMPDADPGYDLVRAVVEDMLHSPPSDRVDAVARRHGVSARTLQRLFRRYIGLGPKWVLQRYRLHEATERMAAGERDLTRLALDLGYFDLAHFTRHFRRVVGRSPTAFLRA